MEYTGSKKRILEVSLDLFSQYGYEATSMSQIADAVGMTKASIYSHFDSKNDIFEKLLCFIAEYYETHTYFSTNDVKNMNNAYMDLKSKSAEEMADILNNQIDFLAFDPVISKLRRLLTIEQFRNDDIKSMKEQRSYTDIMYYYTGLMKYLIAEGVLVNGDPETMALIYTSPTSVLLQKLDRDPSCKDEVHELIRKSTIEFFRVYKK